MKLLYGILFITIIILGSCRGPRVLESVKTDSVYTERVVTLRDTTVVVERDSSYLQALIECDSLGNAYLKQILQIKEGNRARVPVISIEPIPTGNVLNVECECDSLGIYLAMYKIKESEREVKIEKEMVKVEVNRLSWWQKTQLYAFRFLLIIIGIIVFIKNAKSWLRL